MPVHYQTWWHNWEIVYHSDGIQIWKIAGNCTVPNLEDTQTWSRHLCGVCHTGHFPALAIEYFGEENWAFQQNEVTSLTWQWCKDHLPTFIGRDNDLSSPDLNQLYYTMWSVWRDKNACANTRWNLNLLSARLTKEWREVPERKYCICLNKRPWHLEK